MAKNRCLILAIDGLDGSGKTTQVNLLNENLSQSGLKVSVLQHSGGSEIGLLLRSVSKSNAPRSTKVDFYISMAMAYGLADTIANQKFLNDVIIIDRSQLSMYAYNVIAGKLHDKKLGDDSLIEMSQIYGLDAILYLESKDSTNKNRLNKRGKKTDYFENRSVFKSDVLKLGYEKGIELINKRYPKTKIIRLDANGTIADIHNKIAEIIKKML